MSKSTFTPEKVRELAIELYKCSMTPQNNERLITEWLEQNQPEPVVVGLTVEQVIILGEEIRSRPNESETLVIHDWLKTQTYGDTYEEKYLELYDDYQSLIVDKMMVDKELEQLKSQSQPNWDDAPEWANWLAQDKRGLWQWHKDEPFMTASCTWVNHGTQENAISIENWQQTLQERPKPTQQVEVGQVWRYASEGEGGDDYEVTEVTTLEGKFKIGDEWQEDVVMITYENAAQDVYRRILSDFLAKFSLVV